MKDITEKKAPENATPVISGQGICPHCEAVLPIQGEGKIWCWRCGALSYVTGQDAQVWLCRIEGNTQTADLSGDGGENQEILDESIDPDEGLHGLCPYCGERLFSWFEGRCRCEACDGLFVIHWRCGSGRCQWIIDHELFNKVRGRVRTARRDE